MQRTLLSAAFVLLLACLPLPAQRGGGGHASGGGHSSGGGFSSHSGFSGSMGGGHAFSGAHSYSGGVHSYSGHSYNGSRSGASYARRSYGRSPAYRAPLYSSSRGRTHSGTSVRIRTYGYGGYGYGYGRYGNNWGYYGSPYLGGGVDPYWWWGSDSSDPGPQYDNGLANEMNDQGIPMRPPDDDDQSAYARPGHQPERTVAAPATVLVFRDQHKQEVQNYAIVGTTLWNFAPQHTQKIPLSELDIPATTKANDDRGVDFKLPVTQGTLTLEIQSYPTAD
jgi:hypothetical protein